MNAKNLSTADLFVHVGTCLQYGASSFAVSAAAELALRWEAFESRLAALESRLPLDRKPGEGGEKEEDLDVLCECGHRNGIHGSIQEYCQVKNCKCRWYKPRAESTVKVCDYSLCAAEATDDGRCEKHLRRGCAHSDCLYECVRANPAPAAESSEWTTISSLSYGDVFETKAGTPAVISDKGDEGHVFVFGHGSYRPDTRVRRLHTFVIDEATKEAVRRALKHGTPGADIAQEILEAIRGSR